MCWARGPGSAEKSWGIWTQKIRILEKGLRLPGHLEEMFMERGRRIKRPGRQGAAGKPSQWEASPGETISIALTKACRKDSVFLASGCTLATPVPFGAWEHRGPELDISCSLFGVQFLERAGMHCQQALTALLVW